MEQEMTMAGGCDPAPGKPITVTVHAHPPGAKDPFTQSWSEQGGTKHDGNIQCAAKTGSRLITFELDDKSLADLTFAGTASPGTPGDAKKAMYVALDECPDAPGDGGQIVFGQPPSKTRLTVNNRNRGARCDLYYQLNFVDGKGVARPYDPVIENGGDTR